MVGTCLKRLDVQKTSLHVWHPGCVWHTHTHTHTHTHSYPGQLLPKRCTGEAPKHQKPDLVGFKERVHVPQPFGDQKLCPHRQLQGSTARMVLSWAPVLKVRLEGESFHARQVAVLWAPAITRDAAIAAAIAASDPPPPPPELFSPLF